MKFKTLNNQNGVTLIELMISAGLSVFITIIAMMFLQAVAVLNFRAIKGDDIEADLDRFMYTIQNYAFYAVNVRHFQGGTLDGVGSGPGGQGYVRNINIDRYSSPDLGGKPSTTLMFFARESARSTVNPAAANLRSQFSHTAVFYKRRVDNSDPNLREPPAMIIHPGFPMGTVGTQTLSADDNDRIITFNHITDVFLGNQQVEYTQAPELYRTLSSITLRVKAIYPIPTPGAAPGMLECYGPTGDIATMCTNSLPYRVLQKAAVLYFPNNKRHTVNPKHEFLDGFYFFRPAKRN